MTISTDRLKEIADEPMFSAPDVHEIMECAQIAWEHRIQVKRERNYRRIDRKKLQLIEDQGRYIIELKEHIKQLQDSVNWLKVYGDGSPPRYPGWQVIS